MYVMLTDAASLTCMSITASWLMRSPVVSENSFAAYCEGFEIKMFELKTFYL